MRHYLITFFFLLNIGNSSLLAMDSDYDDFLSLGFAQVEDIPGDDAKTLSAEVPLKENPSIKCVFADFEVKAEASTIDSIKIKNNNTEFSISQDKFNELLKEAKELNVKPCHNINIPNQVGLYIKNICKAKDLPLLGAKIKKTFFAFCCNNQSGDEQLLKEACESIYDTCLAKKQNTVASFTNQYGDFEAFLDDNQDYLVIRNKKKLGGGALKEAFLADYVILKGNPKLIGEYVSIKSKGTFDDEIIKMAQCQHENIMLASLKVLESHLKESGWNYYQYLSPKADGEMGKIIFAAAPQEKPFLVIKYALQAAKGLVYLHEQMRWIHMDIKHENIFIQNGIAKISDFGSVQTQNEVMMDFANAQGVGVSCPAPEAFVDVGNKKACIGTAADMWAFGVCLFQLLSPRHEKPYFGNNTNQVIWDTLDDDLFASWQPEDKETKAYQLLVKNLLVRDKTKRLNAVGTVLFLKENHDLSSWKNE